MCILFLDPSAALRVVYGVQFLAFSTFDLAVEYQEKHNIKGLIICID